MVAPPRGQGRSPSSQATPDPSKGNNGAVERKGRQSGESAGRSSCREDRQPRSSPSHQPQSRLASRRRLVVRGGSGRGRNEAAAAGVRGRSGSEDGGGQGGSYWEGTGFHPLNSKKIMINKRIDSFS
jgi:hypothetical protein